MEPQKFVLRLLDHAGELLAWSTISAIPAPQDRAASCPFWSIDGRTTRVAIEKSGRATEISVHWCELDVARRSDIEEVDVEAGQVFDFTWLQPVWLVAGTRDVPLPAVTVRATVIVNIPSGSLTGATTQ
jgi:hypothetical protein